MGRVNKQSYSKNIDGIDQEVLYLSQHPEPSLADIIQRECISGCVR